ncbi:MAG TPA: nitroreductase family protein [Clostridiaceae bacterium]|nr:nitroreductase family protein [Clostridiaceae bacterium]
MDVLEAIFTRRSIRKYTGAPVSEADLKTILKAGFCAPSAMNLQPRHFVVLKDSDILNKITEIHPYAEMLTQAGCGILVCGDRTKQSEIGYIVEDCSASIQNMLLAAHGLGLGAVWCGVYPREQRVNGISQLLKLPENIVPVGLVVVGHKDESKEPNDRYDETKVHFDKW